MQDRSEKRDLRIVKTTKTLNAAMFSLLERLAFRKITVRNICEEAQISRATFYARFADKYDFLKDWLKNLIPEGLDESSPYIEIEQKHNESFYKNKTVLRNLLLDADSETLEIVAEFTLTFFMLSDKYDIKKTTTEQVVLSHFFTGGVVFYLLWQVKNKSYSDVTPMNIHLYELITKFREWELDSL